MELDNEKTRTNVIHKNVSQGCNKISMWSFE